MNALLEEAVAIDSGFAMAWRKLGLTRTRKRSDRGARKRITRDEIG